MGSVNCHVREAGASSLTRATQDISLSVDTHVAVWEILKTVSNGKARNPNASKEVRNKLRQCRKINYKLNN